MKFEVCIEGEKFEFASVVDACTKYDALLKEGFYEVVMRMIDGSKVYDYNRRVGAFFPRPY